MPTITSSIRAAQAIQQRQQAEHPSTAAKHAQHAKLTNNKQITIGAVDEPTKLILQSAMDKINEVFKPYLGDGAVERAVSSNMDYSPKGTAERIMSFAIHLVGRVEKEQQDYPVEQQRSREQLLGNIRLGIDNGFTQSRDILESMQALHGTTKETVDATYDFVQQGLSEFTALLGILPSNQTKA